MDIEERINRLDERVEKLESKVNEAIPEIQSGIKEIKTILQERPIQEELKNNLLGKDISNHETRIKKIEDNQSWLWKTVGASIIAIVFVIKTM